MDSPAFQPLAGGACLLPSLGLIRASGADAVTFLHGQLSNDVKLLPPERARLAAFCTAQGRMLASLIYAKSGPDEVWLALSRDLLEPTLKRLRMFVLRAKVQLDDASGTTDTGDGLCALGLAGLSAAQALGPTAPAQAWGKTERAGGLLIRLPDALAAPRWLWIGPKQAAAQVQGDLPELDPLAWDWLEVASGVAPVRAATSGQFVPQMLNYELVGGVDFKKGCYPGQEVVARSQYLGKLKRRAYLLHSAEVAQPGQEVWWSGDERQPSGQVAASAPVPSGQGSGWLVLAELKIAATADGNLHLGSASGAPLELQTLPYALPHEAEAA
jgi:folate-binding protein YgfZ